MIGSGALGQFALGQVPFGTVVLSVSPGSFSVAGVPSFYRLSEAVQLGAFSLSLVPASFETLISADPSAVALTGVGSVSQISLSSGNGTYSVSGVSTAPLSAGSYSYAGQASLFRQSMASVRGDYLFAGLDVIFRQIGPGLAASGSYVTAYSPAFFKTTFGASPTSYTTTFSAAGFTSKLGAIPASYSVSVSATYDGEIWRDRTNQSEIWTKVAPGFNLDTSFLSPNYLGFASVGQVALGQGFYRGTAGWKEAKRQSEIWTERQS